MSALYWITVTEAPRVGQRKPRRFHFAVVARSTSAAVRAFKATSYGACYGGGEGDTVQAAPLPSGEVVKLAW